METSQSHHDGKKFKTFIKNKLQLSVEDFGKKYLQDKSRAAVFAMLRKETFALPEIALFCMYFRLSPTFFNQPADLFSTEHNVDTTTTIDFVSLNAFDKTEQGFNGFIDQYYSQIISCIQEAAQYIIAYNYLGKVRGVPFSGLPQKTKDYYSAIETQTLESTLPDFTYTLILALPIQEKSKIPESFKDTTKRAIRHMFSETFHHVVRLFKDFEKKFAFYAIPSPTRLYSYQLIDERYVITEYDKHDRSGVPSNNLLFINRVKKDTIDDPIKILHHGYLKEVEEIKNEANTLHQTKVTKESFTSAVYELHQDTLYHIKVLEKKRFQKTTEKFDLEKRIEDNQDNEELSKQLATVLDEIDQLTTQIRLTKRERNDILKKKKYLQKCGL